MSATERTEELVPRDDVTALDRAIAGIDPHDSDAARRERRLLLRRFWMSASGFWAKDGDRLAWLLPGAILLTVLLSLAAAYGMNVWNRYIFDALERRDGATVLLLAIVYVPLLIGSVCLIVTQVYARMTTQWRWRAWLNDHLLDRWLTHGRYYHLNLVAGDHKNPEYRIADDIRVATELPIEFMIGLTTAVLSAITFIAVLWVVGGSLSFGLAGHTITIPGFLVVAAMLYAAIASGAMVFIGRRFVTVAENKNQAEAEYRYTLTRLRENGESIAVLQGEREERTAAGKSMGKVLQCWREMCVQTMRAAIVSQTSNYVAYTLPIILCAPKFLDGSMTLGQVMQSASAFTTVQYAFNWFVEHYPRLVEWVASARRVSSLMVSLDALERGEADGVGRIARGAAPDAALRLCGLSVTLEDGTVVVKDAEVAIPPGERVMVTGDSGTGKSTLVRAIAGLWPWGDGTVQVAKGAKMLLMPQRPYIPVGTLRRAVTYPSPPDARSGADIIRALELVGLAYLVVHLDEDEPWDQILSGGEKQRLAFARILLHRPAIVVLDEATSALDPASQDQLMEMLTTELGATTIVSVAHRPELEVFHNRRITLERRRGGARLVTDIRLAPQPGHSHELAISDGGGAASRK
jgi:putative ATP-binding cassette transporter